MADDAAAHSDILNQAAQGQLKSIIERIERLEQEKSEIAEQVKEVFAVQGEAGLISPSRRSRRCLRRCSGMSAM